MRKKRINGKGGCAPWQGYGMKKGLSESGIYKQYIVVKHKELQVYIVENCHFPTVPFQVFLIRPALLSVNAPFGRIS